MARRQNTIIQIYLYFVGFPIILIGKYIYTYTIRGKFSGKKPQPSPKAILLFR